MTPEGPRRVVMLVSDQPVAGRVRWALPDATVRVASCVDASQLDGVIRAQTPDLLIVDLDTTDPAVLAHLPAAGEGRRVPVLGLTGRHDTAARLAALDMGADDVMDLAFTPDELLVRATALVHRSGGGRPATPRRAGGLEVDALHRHVRVDGVAVHLTGVEQSLLSLLMEHGGEVVDREQILDAVWGSDFVPDSNVVERHIRSLRRKLGDDWHRPRYIETVHGKGYRLRPEAAADVR